MDTKNSGINQAMAEVLDGERGSVRVENGRELAVERLANEAGISYRSMRRILKAEVDVKIGDILVIIGVINRYRRTPLTADEVMASAVKRAGGMDAINAEFGVAPLPTPEPVSEDSGTTDDLEAKRRQKQGEAAAMTLDELERQQNAATRDRELDQDQPPET